MSGVPNRVNTKHLWTCVQLRELWPHEAARVAAFRVSPSVRTLAVNVNTRVSAAYLRALAQDGAIPRCVTGERMRDRYDSP